ncbi:hypothetical protein RRSWK_06803 [Rhodopirellula sp. SWK7]|nr:hypothetical protein RRSWK_06803 [Rhodopirellula sp. SWK7]
MGGTRSTLGARGRVSAARRLGRHSIRQMPAMLKLTLVICTKVDRVAVANEY